MRQNHQINSSHLLSKETKTDLEISLLNPPTQIFFNDNENTGLFIR